VNNNWNFSAFTQLFRRNNTNNLGYNTIITLINNSFIVLNLMETVKYHH